MVWDWGGRGSWGLRLGPDAFRSFVLVPSAERPAVIQSQDACPKYDTGLAQRGHALQVRAGVDGVVAAEDACLRTHRHRILEPFLQHEVVRRQVLIGGVLPLS